MIHQRHLQSVKKYIQQHLLSLTMWKTMDGGSSYFRSKCQYKETMSSSMESETCHYDLTSVLPVAD